MQRFLLERGREIVIFTLGVLLAVMLVRTGHLEGQVRELQATASHLKVTANNLAADHKRRQAAVDKQQIELQFMQAWRDDAGPRELKLHQELNDYFQLYGPLPKKVASKIKTVVPDPD